MVINFILQKGGALNREQWHGAAEEVSKLRGAHLSFLNFHPPFVKKDLLRIRNFEIDGLLGMFGREDYANFVRQLGIPVVSIYGGRPFAGIPQVGTNDREIGLVAAKHLYRPRVASFGYFGLPNLPSSRARWAGFSVGLMRRGGRASAFRHAKEAQPSGRYKLSRLISWEEQLYAWLETLQKPCAIFCYDDLRAYWLAGVCERMGLHMPDEVAILGVGNDMGYVLATTPHLSSVIVPYQEEGKAAAALLCSLIAGKKQRPQKPIFLRPAGVAVRGSTDILHVTNPHVVKALRFVRQQRGIGISVEDVANHGGCCRKVLERLFRQHLDSTILAEMRKEQIEQVRIRLRADTASIEQIADECGYSSLNHLARDFKKRTGIAPGAYRRSFMNPE